MTDGIRALLTKFIRRHFNFFSSGFLYVLVDYVLYENEYDRQNTSG